MKIAICYAGLTRCFKEVSESHINNILQIFTNNNIEYDIYIHTWIGSHLSDNNPDDFNSIGTIKQMKVDDQNITFLDSLIFENYFYQHIFDTIGGCVAGEWIPSMLKNHLCYIESQKRVANMVIESQINYDNVLFLRADSIINEPICINTIINQPNNSILIPTYCHFGGYTDTVALCTLYNLKYFSHRIDNAIEHRKNVGRIAAEPYLKCILDNSPLKVILTDFIKISLLRYRNNTRFIENIVDYK